MSISLSFSVTNAVNIVDFNIINPMVVVAITLCTIAIPLCCYPHNKADETTSQCLKYLTSNI
jgi:hypothetical protein